MKDWIVVYSWKTAEISFSAQVLADLQKYYNVIIELEYELNQQRINYFSYLMAINVSYLSCNYMLRMLITV